MTPISTTVNGQPRSGLVEARTSLADFLRGTCGLTGTHLGCEHGVCGACTVLVNDEPVRSCILYAVQAEDMSVRTIEGFDDDPIMAELRKAFTEEHALQCGFCTPGMLITARDIVCRLHEPDEARIRAELAGNLCRCTGYVGIVNAIKRVCAESERVPRAAKRATPAFASAVDVALSPSAPLPQSLAGEQDSRLGAAEGQSGPARGGQVVPTGRDRRGGISVQQAFTVPYAPDRVWTQLTDLADVVGCLPGAELLEAGDGLLKGKIVIKFGPIRAQFAGNGTYAFDHDARRGLLTGSGKDALSGSRADGELTFSVIPAAEQGSTVTATLDFSIQGMLAQFSRSSLVQGFIERTVRLFAENLAVRLGGPPPNLSGEPVGRGIWTRIGGFLGRIFRARR